MFEGKKLSAITIAAGSGSRMQSAVNKPFIEIGGKRVIEFTLDKLIEIPEIDDIFLVIRREDEDLVDEILEKYPKKIKKVYGAETRELSTLEGLRAVDGDSKFVLTHDGVRPFASLDLFKRTIEELKSFKAVITAVKSKDTVKIVDDRMLVKYTPYRKYIYNAQTPQAYDKDLLLSLYEKYENSEFTITDDSQLFELLDREVGVRVIEGEYSNIKLTTPEDIEYARFLLEERR